jgi:hypothetical protein
MKNSINKPTRRAKCQMEEDVRSIKRWRPHGREHISRASYTMKMSHHHSEKYSDHAAQNMRALFPELVASMPHGSLAQRFSGA